MDDEVCVVVAIGDTNTVSVGGAAAVASDTETVIDRAPHVAI